MDLMKKVLDDLNESIIILDPEGRIKLFNKEAVRINKKISAIALKENRPFVDCVSEERKHIVAENLLTVRRHGKVVRNLAEYTGVSGAKVILEITFSPIKSNGGSIEYINVVAQDISIRKAHERKSVRENESFRNVLETAHALFFTVDSRGYITDWNTHCANLTGFSKDDVLQKRLFDLVSSDQSQFQSLLEDTLSSKVAQCCELTMRTACGGEIVAVLTASRRTNPADEAIGLTFIGQDITELIQYRRSMEKIVQSKTTALEENLKKQQDMIEMKSRFVSIASHEFRTPLNSIDYAANFIKRNAGTIGKRKLNEKVKVIEKHVHHMSHLLEDVLSYSQQDRSIRVMAQHIDLEKFVARVVSDVQCCTRRSHNIVMPEQAPGFVIGDENLLRNILTNLLTNAIKFSPGCPEVFLSVRNTDTALLIDVKDNGIGIAEAEREIIFEPFVRGRDSGVFPGNGLGLSIVKRAVEAMNGTIKVESSPGSGTLFSVSIPQQNFG